MTADSRFRAATEASRSPEARRSPHRGIGKGRAVNFVNFRRLAA
jgi:hypothetical protein